MKLTLWFSFASILVSANASANTITVACTRVLAKPLREIAGRYHVEHPGETQVKVVEWQSSEGMKCLRDGSCAFLVTSSAISDHDTDLDMQTIGSDGFVFVVNKSNPVDSVTRAQAKGLACGEITNWKQVGGKDMPVMLFRRDEKNSAGEVIVKTFGCSTGKPTKDPVGADIYKLTSNEGALAYGGYVVMMSVRDKVKILALDGVLPSTETIQNGKYWLKRSVYVVKAKKEPTAETELFLKYLLDQRAAVFPKYGLVP